MKFQITLVLSLFLITNSCNLFTKKDKLLINGVIHVDGFYQIIEVKDTIISADSSLITGHIFSVRDSSLLPYSFVEIIGLKSGATANENAYYSYLIPQGNYSLKAQSINQIIFTDTIFFKENTNTIIDFYITYHAIY